MLKHSLEEPRELLSLECAQVSVNHVTVELQGMQVGVNCDTPQGVPCNCTAAGVLHPCGCAVASHGVCKPGVAAYSSSPLPCPLLSTWPSSVFYYQTLIIYYLPHLIPRSRWTQWFSWCPPPARRR